MYLKLTLDGDITVTFRIREYDHKITASDDWCVVDLLVQKPGVLNYELYEDETLEGHEVRSIKDLIAATIKGEDRKPYEPTEPYMVFEPGKDPIHLIWKIYIWSGVEYNTDSTIALYLLQEDMERLLSYLKLITGDITKNEVTGLIEEGILVEDDGKAWRDKWDS